jgi:hypothetical protein
MARFNVLFLLLVFCFSLLLQAADVVICKVDTTKFDGIQRFGNILEAIKNMAL